MVLFVAVSLFDFNYARNYPPGYPDLPPDIGQYFNVLVERGDYWLAFHQEDPAQKIGWIWEKQFRRIGQGDY